MNPIDLIVFAAKKCKEFVFLSLVISFSAHSMEAPLIENSELELVGPPLRYLDKLHQDLKFLQFIDHKLFVESHETWKDYDYREAGSVGRLFMAAAMTAESLIINTNKPFYIDIEYIKSIHRLVANEIPGFLQPGVFRPIKTCYLLPPDITTREGIKEFLVRIQKDRRPDGFRLGKIETHPLYLTFYQKLEEIFQQIKDPDLVNLEEIEKSALIAAWDEIKTKCSTFEFAEVKELLLSVFEVSIRKILEQETEAMKKEDSINKKLGKLSNIKMLLAYNCQYKKPRQEHMFLMEHARARAFAEAGTGSEQDISYHTIEQIEDLATMIYDLVQKKEVTLLVPEILLAEEAALKAIDEYNSNIKLATKAIEKITVIDKVVHALETLHVFNDCNGRTNYILLNILLLGNGIKCTMLYDPNRIDGYSTEERRQEIIAGIHRFEDVSERAQEIIKAHTEIGVNRPQYAELAQPLLRVLAEHKKQLQKIYQDMLDKYTSPQMLFSLNIIPNGHLAFALKQVLSFEDYEAFLARIRALQESRLQPQMHKDLELLMRVTSGWLPDYKATYQAN